MSTLLFRSLMPALLVAGLACETDPLGSSSADLEARQALPSAAATVTHEVTINEPFDFLVFIPCAAGGTGEEVLFTGNINIVIHSTITGSRVSMSERNTFHISGEGLLTGDKYQSTQALHFSDSGSLVNGQFSSSFVAHAAVTGPGPGNNMYLPTTIHTTINAKGEVTAEVETFDFVCK